MKKIILLAVLLQLTCSAQITFDTKYTVSNPGPYGLNFTRFSSAGFKYNFFDVINHKIDLYNANHSLYLSMSVPIPTTTMIYEVHGISDRLFNQDSLIEYVVTGDGSNGSYKVSIFNQNGTLLFSKDSATIAGQDFEDMVNHSGIYYDGIRYKMKLLFPSTSQLGSPNQFLIYNLPGSLPCTSCSTFTIPPQVMVGSNKITRTAQDAVFFPNPTNSELKLKYQLPEGYRTAEIRISDSQGKHIQDFKITNVFDFIYLPADFNDGTYMYSLYVDEKLVKTAKIVLTR